MSPEYATSTRLTKGKKLVTHKNRPPGPRPRRPPPPRPLKKPRSFGPFKEKFFRPFNRSQRQNRPVSIPKFPPHFPPQNPPPQRVKNLQTTTPEQLIKATR
jgi:hypothetical protein